MSFDDGRTAVDLRRSPAIEPHSSETIRSDSFGGANSVPIAPAATSSSGAKTGRAIREIVETLLLAVVIFVGVRSLVLNFRVDGTSMTPNLTDREMLLVNRNVYFNFDLHGLLNILPGVDYEDERIIYPFHPPERGDIVVFNPPIASPKPFIKRIIGLPGDTVEVRSGDVYVNSTLVDEPYIDDGITGCGTTRDCAPVNVPAGSIFVMGDNRSNSSDSRSFGPVAIDSIIGKAWITYWPSDHIGLVPHYDYPGLEG
ncbi:MAG: signal peptidase I [Chloroflexota bacterium]|nr:signal peptidase I [Chloroflexota bacterium]